MENGTKIFLKKETKEDKEDRKRQEKVEKAKTAPFQRKQIVVNVILFVIFLISLMLAILAGIDKISWAITIPLIVIIAGVSVVLCHYSNKISNRNV